MNVNMRNRLDRDPDAAIRETDSDAAIARLSAVNKNYLLDPFISLFIPQSQFIPPRPPLINWGTYIRSKIIDDLIVDWARIVNAIQSGSSFQMVSLGAGSDTRFWRLANGLLRSNDNLVSNCSRYLEIDFPEMVRKKIAAIKRYPMLHTVLGEFTESATSLTSSKYVLQGVDLRNFADFSQVISLLDPTLPTLVLSECVLVYMTKAQSDALLRHFTETFPCVGAIVYEMYGLNDDFGRVMKANLKTRNLTLPGIDAYTTLNDQVSRFLQTGFTRGQARSLKTLRYQYIDDEERNRLSKLEFLDEVEELDLVLDHYAISWGLKSSGPFENSVQEGSMDWGVKPILTTVE